MYSFTKREAAKKYQPNINVMEIISEIRHKEFAELDKKIEQREKEVEEMRKIAALFADWSSEIPEVSFASLEVAVLQRSNDLIEKILSNSPPPKEQVDALVGFLSKFLIGSSCSHIFNDDEQILEAFAKFVCTAAANPLYEASYRHSWLSTLAKLLTQRAIDDISLPPLFWVYYGRSQLLLARDYFGEERAKILLEAIEFLSLNLNDADTRIMIGILKAEIFINCSKAPELDRQKEWFDIGSCFTQQGGTCLDSQLHYALCLTKRIFSEPNDKECYREVLRLLGSRYLKQCFESISTKAKTDLWWRECVETITDVCVRTALSLKDLRRDRFLDQLDERLKRAVVDVLQRIEAPNSESNE